MSERWGAKQTRRELTPTERRSECVKWLEIMATEGRLPTPAGEVELTRSVRNRAANRAQELRAEHERELLAAEGDGGR